MIASLEGVVGAVFGQSLVLEVGGIGYRVFAAPTLLVSAPGSRLKVHTHHLVREDLQALYGFRTPEELGFFGLLLTVTGVGPKVALAILGSRPVGDLQLAIMGDDQAVLDCSVSGVGRRLAGRIVLELREKVAAAGLGRGFGGRRASASSRARRARRSRRSSRRSRRWATRLRRRARAPAWAWPGRWWRPVRWAGRRWRSRVKARAPGNVAAEMTGPWVPLPSTGRPAAAAFAAAGIRTLADLAGWSAGRCREAPRRRTEGAPNPSTRR